MTSIDGISRRLDMKMERIVIQLPLALKAKLDALRAQGTSASGFIRNLLTQYFNKPHEGRKAR
jgi:metal-responsive CopG/Arc/MetJ family transcriptional regulator